MGASYDLRRVSFDTAERCDPVGPVELGDDELSAVHGGTPTFGPICTAIATESATAPAPYGDFFPPPPLVV